MNSYIALYRKWRPKSFADVVGQEHITEVLSGEVLSGNVSHAYLFCGSRGTGKTTCAKIFARAINCENTVNGDPCGECEACRLSETSFDIVEMDAASNNGVDEIRKLREEVLYPPTEMKKKVYIIDEVHMLSSSAFNALLKTLEEPPEHVVFILATTELNKIPVTILSRCKRFDFHRITPEKIFGRVKFIAETEGINITDEALRLISRLATGAMRDALSALEMFVGKDSEKIIDEKSAAETLGVMGKDAVLDTIGAIAEKNITKALEIVWRIYDSGKDLSVLCSECGEIFRDMLMIKFVSDAEAHDFLKESAANASELSKYAEMFTTDRLIFCTETLEETMQRLTRGSFSRRTVFETALFKLCGIAVADIPENVSSKVSTLEERLLKIERALKNGTVVCTDASNSGSTPVENSRQKAEKPVENKAVKPAVDIDYGFSESDIPPEEQAPFDVPFDIGTESADRIENAKDNVNTSSAATDNATKKEYSPYDDVPFDVPKPLENEENIGAQKVGTGFVDNVVEKAENPVENLEDALEASQKVSHNASGNGAAGTKKPVTNFNEVVGLLQEKDKMYISFLNNAKAYYSGENNSDVTVELAGFAYTFISSSEKKKGEITEAIEKVLGYEARVRFIAATGASAAASPWSL